MSPELPNDPTPQTGGLTRRSLLLGGATAAAGALLPVAGPAPRSEASGLLFHADYGRRAVDAYGCTNPRGLVRNVDYGLTRDPRGGRRSVAWFDNHRGMSQGTPYARSSVSSEPFMKAAYHGVRNDVYWVGFSMYLPRAHRLRSLYAWCSVSTGAFGPPWGGPSPLSLALVRCRDGHHRLELAGNPWLIGDGLVVPTDTWVNVVTGFKLSYRGWVEMYTSQGAGNRHLRPVPVNGQRRAPYDTLRPHNNDAWVKNSSLPACYTSVGVYATQKMRLLFGHHKVGRSLSQVVA